MVSTPDFPIERTLDVNDTLTGVKNVKDSQEGLLIAYSRAEWLEDAGESNRQILSLYFIVAVKVTTYFTQPLCS